MTVDTHRLRALLEDAGLERAAARKRAEQIALLEAHGEPLDAQARELLDKLASRFGSAETAAIPVTPPGTEATLASPDLDAAALGVDTTWKGQRVPGLPEAPVETLPPPGRPPAGGRSSPSIAPGERVDQYEVIRLIGKGGMGAVYLARDVLLGRKVALKVVHPNLLATAGAVDRFLFEARATASFNHPNIVTIYGLGQVHGCPYVALEYLPGYSLRERLREGPLAVGEVVAMGRRVAEALTEAHRQGLLHCDLKPENVFLPRDGRLRVLDFGLARLVSRAPGVGAPDTSAGDGDAPAAGSGSGQRTGLRGTAAYMAPEQWTQAELTPAVDLWALGVTLFEMLTGERPFSGSLVALYEQVTSEAVPVPSVADRKIGLPGVLADLCARCLRRAPAERPTAADVVDALSRMSGGATRLPASDAECPYRGLQPFRRAHAELFFGRTEETAAFIERLRETALLAVVGPSGAGKSSFIQAGVAPRLETLGPWESLVLRPGAAPFAALASRLLRSPTLATDSAPAFPDGDRRQADAELTLADQLRAEPALLGRQLRQRAAERGTRILVLVDQLEEIFTLTTDAATRRAFADALLFAADDPVGPVKIVLTIRDDFLGRLAEFEALVAEVSRGIVVIRTPGAEALAETLTEPAARVGYRFEDERLVAEMVAEVASEPAGLPLLQFAAERLWEGRDRAARVLRRTTYETIGGVAGALAEHADRVLAGLVGEASGAAREVLLRLVTTEGTRASVKDSELVAQVGPGAAEAIEHLVAARLVVSRRSLAEGHATTELELVHESLITRWERLRRWREESRDEVTLEQDLRDAATQWHRRGQRAEDLWRGLSLAEALDWQGRRRVPLPEDLAQFIERSDREAQHQASRLARLRLGLLGGVLLVALSIGAFLWVRAKEQRTAAAREIAVLAQAEARHQLGQALIEGAQAARLRGDLAEARAKLRASFEVEDSVSARALYAELLKDPLQFRASEPAAVISVAVAPDGKTVATGSYDGTIRLWDWMTGSARVLRGHQKEVFSLAFAPDGRFLLSGSGDGDARLWTLAGSEARVLRSHLERVHAVAVAPDGRTVATATADGLITLIPLSPQGGQEVRTLRGHVGRVTTLEFAPDGRSLASAGDDRAIRIWTLASGEARRLEGHTDGVLVVAFGQHGRQLASASEDQTVRIWDLATGKARVLEGHRGGVTALAFHPRRPWVASGGSDTTVRVWELDTGAERVLPRHRDRVTGLSWGNVDDLLATCSYDREVRVLGLGTPEPPPARGHTDWVSGVAFSPDGRTLASASQDRTIRLWDVTTGRSRALRGHTARVMTVAYRADGQVLASTGWDGTVRLWNLATGQVRVLRGHTERVYGLAFAPSGDQVASAGWDREVRVWDLATGTARILRGHTDRVFSLAYAPDGKTLASGAWDGTVRLWDPATGQARVLSGHQNRVTGIAFAPSGAFLVSGSYDRTVRIWDLATGTSRALQGHGDFIWGVAVSPDSRVIASASRDEQIRLWDAASGRLIRTIHGHTRDVNRVAFSPAGDLLASTGDDSTVRLWELPSGRPRWRAPLLEAGPGLRLVTGQGALDASTLEAAEPPRSQPRDPADQQLLAEVVATARRAEPSETGDRLTLLTWDGRVTLWGTRPAMRFWGSDAGGADQAVPFGAGVAVLASGAVTQVSLPGGGRQVLVTEGATFLEVAGRELLVATPREVRRFDGRGTLLGRHRVDVGVTAATVRSPDLVVGHRDGLFELLPLAGGQRQDRPFEDTPAHPVTRLVAGPAGTLAAGFRDGTVGLWNVQTGKLLERRALHGPVAHLRILGSTLLAASELGDTASLDLAVFHRKRCALMRQIWRRFPGTWEAGLAVRRPAPGGHACSAVPVPDPPR